MHRRVSAAACVWWDCDLWKEEPWNGRSLLGTAFVVSLEAGLAHRNLLLGAVSLFLAFTTSCISPVCLQLWDQTQLLFFPKKISGTSSS